MKPRVQDMHPELQTKYLAFAGKMAEKGIPFALACVIRTKSEQEAFYAQGREPLENVNAKRMTAGMCAIVDIMDPKQRGVIIRSAESQNVIVTHTKNSRHFPDENGYSRAFDIVILKGDKTPTWDLKYDGQDDGITDYIEAAQIGMQCGLESGGLWHGFKDFPHYQLPDGKAQS